jgi:hypothetical protein
MQNLSLCKEEFACFFVSLFVLYSFPRDASIQTKFGILVENVPRDILDIGKYE